MCKLILTHSYSDLFYALTEQLEKLNNVPEQKNLIFCEAKVSLMVERFICAQFKGSFNTDVFSFGKFLRTKKTIDNLLSKEGSAMVIKRILSSVQLKCFKQSKHNLASTVYDLIIQLKSAKISPDDVLRATQNTKGTLKNKLLDLALIYAQYEEYIVSNGFEDQSSMLSYLPEVIYSSKEIENCNVFLFGYGSFTAQMRAGVSALLEKAKSVTAILVEGQNERLYVNETPNVIRALCKGKGIELIEEKRAENFNPHASIIAKNLYSPRVHAFSKNKAVADDICVLEAKNPYEEICRVAEVIRRSVVGGACRYRDISIAVNDETYKDYIKSVFAMHNVPLFYDESKVPENHPLVRLVTDYIDVKRKNFERETLCAFFKNPLLSVDKDFQDKFETYLIKYNINYGAIKKPFTFPFDGVEIDELEKFRMHIVSLFESFDLRGMLDKLCVRDRLNELSQNLSVLGQKEESAVCDRIYDAVINILNQMDVTLKGVPLTLSEYKSMFLSGVEAMEISIIPQYNDAVFVGAYKEVALANAKKLFAIGLTTDVPTVRADVALLSDADISALEEIQVLIEPKIRVVNHRLRENLALALCAFSETLYLSYPSSSTSGKKNVKSQVLTDILSMFDCKKFPEYDGYASYGQGLNTFAKACGEFAEGKTVNDMHYDFTGASSFYSAVDKEKLYPILDRANKEVKVKLECKNRSLIDKVTSPTTIEDYYQCPYRAFLAHTLKIRERDEGKVDGLSVGKLMHEILRSFVIRLGEINDITTPTALFDEIKDKVLERNEFKRFLYEPSTMASVDRVLRECKQYCNKTYNSLKKSAFTKSVTEVAFGDGATFPAVSLLGGKAKLKGVIDRVDESDKYFRVIDYKTGKADANTKSLFAGVKLQLYLYAVSVQKEYEKKGGKAPVGLYYLPITDKYEKQEEKQTTLAVGKTLDDDDALIVQDEEFFENKKSLTIPADIDEKGNKKHVVDGKTLEAYLDYAVKISESAISKMEDGVIVASPYEGACDYCEFLALCQNKDACARKLNAVSDKTFLDAIDKGKG